MMPAVPNRDDDMRTARPVRPVGNWTSEAPAIVEFA